MPIVKASLAGFCFGVKRAVDMINEIIERDSGEVYTLGHLIHNPVFNSRLAERGVINISNDEIDGVLEKAASGEKISVVIRTHGTTSDISKKLFGFAAGHKNFTVYDCTCPKVKKIHEIVERESRPGDLLIVFGSKEHPEVLGIVSYAGCETVVIESHEDLSSLLPTKRPVIMVSQTTQKLTEWKHCREIVEKVCTSPRIFDTICGVTEKRQTEVSRLAAECEVMLVVGGRESSNTNKLYQIAKALCPDTFFVETTADIPLAYIGRNLKIGIVAGASTPDDIIGEVISKMSEEVAKTGAETENEFVSQLDEYGSVKTVRNGEKVTGVIAHIGSTEVTVDLNTNVTGIMPTEELGTPEEIEANYHVGDAIEAKVIKVSDKEGVATLSRRNVINAENLAALKESLETKVPIECKISEAVKGGLRANFKGTKIFIPASHSTVPKNGDFTAMIGTVQPVTIIELSDRDQSAVGSIRIAKNASRREAAEKFWEEAEVGKEYDGEVRSITSYGAFVDLGGVDGMVHVSELSWSRIKTPEEVVKVGDVIHVFIKDLDRERKRISLGYKTEESNPWNIFMSKYAVDDVVNVTIQGLTTFGAFAEIIPGVDGLIHVSQIANRKIEKPADVLKKGDKVDVKITAIDEENQRISLSIRALLDDEAEAEEEQIKADAGDLLITEDDEPAEEAEAEEAEEEPAAKEPEEAAEEPAEETTEE